MKKIFLYFGYFLLSTFFIFILAYAFAESFFIKSDDFEDVQFLRNEAEREHQFDAEIIVDNIDSIENSYAW